MGKYLELAKKVEERREDLSTTEAESLDIHAQYCQTASVLAEDCFAIDPNWLINVHPELWFQLVHFDCEATKLERSGESGVAYQRLLNDLTAAVKRARALYEKSGDQLPM